MTDRRSSLDENSEVYDRIMGCINSHVGEKNAITQVELLTHLHQISYKFRHEIPTTRDLLRVIHDMRRAGFMIASCSRGYFRPVDGKEARAYLKTVLQSRALDLMKTIRAQRRAITTEYDGQMRMEE